MNRLDEILEYNKAFVDKGLYQDFITTKYPDKKIIVLSCMDTRLTQLLPKALNLQNGDAKFISNAGAVLSHPFGSIMRSIIVAIYELEVEEVLVISHHGCGMNNVEPKRIIEAMKQKGISDETLYTLRYSGIDLNDWLRGFDCVFDSVKESVDKIRNHPLITKDITVHGLIADPETGALEVIVNGYDHCRASKSTR
ncbi:MAG: carbonic anhydrase [Eubacteriales bacterium]|nr:carbonic anhydrase [Eubacteriales bacterium]